MDVVKVTLDGDLVDFVPPLDQPSNYAGTTSAPYTSTYNNSNINANIESVGVANLDIANGKLYYGLNTALPAALSTTQAGDLVYMGGGAYYVSVVDLAAGYITIATDP